MIRPANERDVPVIYQMLRESAAAQDAEDALCVDPANLLEDGFRANPPRFQCLIAEVDGQAAGMALYYFDYSTWISRSGVFLEDLYVRPAARRRGVARALMVRMAEIASGAGSLRMAWLVLKENVGAAEFYGEIGAQHLSDWSVMRLGPEELKRLAQSGS